MKPLFMHVNLVRMACLPALLVLGACGAKPAADPGTLDLGGGISMTAASDYNPFPPGAPTPLFFSSAAQWFPPSADQTSALKTSID